MELSGELSVAAKSHPFIATHSENRNSRVGRLEWVAIRSKMVVASQVSATPEGGSGRSPKLMNEVLSHNVRSHDVSLSFVRSRCCH